jgi:predicted MPP superfamily phosphohydrolase
MRVFSWKALLEEDPDILRQSDADRSRRLQPFTVLRENRRVRRTLRVTRWLAVLIATWGFVVEPCRLVVRRAAVPVHGFSRPLRIVALADVHTGSPWNWTSNLRRVVARANAEGPDLVVLLGDYVIHGVLGGRFVPPEEIAPILGGLRARLGVVAVLGNHDGWLDAPRVERALESAGIPVLSNEARPLGDGEERFWVAGLADAWTSGASVTAALRDVPPEGPVLLLTHNPDVFPGVPDRVGLTLAGHTHGGQVSLPFFGPPIVPSRFGQRYAAGLVEEDGRLLFVTTGIGTSIVPVRIGVPPEIAVLDTRPSGTTFHSPRP